MDAIDPKQLSLGPSFNKREEPASFSAAHRRAMDEDDLILAEGSAIRAVDTPAVFHGQRELLEAIVPGYVPLSVGAFPGEKARFAVSVLSAVRSLLPHATAREAVSAAAGFGGGAVLDVLCDLGLLSAIHLRVQTDMPYDDDLY